MCEREKKYCTQLICKAKVQYNLVWAHLTFHDGTLLYQASLPVAWHIFGKNIGHTCNANQILPARNFYKRAMLLIFLAVSSPCRMVISPTQIWWSLSHEHNSLRTRLLLSKIKLVYSNLIVYKPTNCIQFTSVKRQSHKLEQNLPLLVLSNDQ